MDNDDSAIGNQDVYIAKSGQSGVPTQTQFIESSTRHRKDATYIGEDKSVNTTVVNLDSNQDFQYGINRTGTTGTGDGTVEVWLMGYYLP